MQALNRRTENMILSLQPCTRIDMAWLHIWTTVDFEKPIAHKAHLAIIFYLYKIEHLWLINDKINRMLTEILLVGL